MMQRNLVLALVSICACMQSCGQVTPKKENAGLPDVDKIDASQVLKIGFKQWLKEKGHSMDIGVNNPYETFQPGNLYSNHYYNLVVDFPNTWTPDRGAGRYSLFRTVQEDSALSVSLIVTSANVTGSEKSKMSAEDRAQMEEHPYDFQNDRIPEGLMSYMQRQLRIASGIEPEDMKFEERRMGRLVFLVTTYRNKEWLDDIEYYRMTETWATSKWGNAYTLVFSGPEIFYDPSLMAAIANKAQFMNPEALGNGR